jgi:hypothetical protein
MDSTTTAWFNATDDLTGTQATFGDPTSTHTEWNIKFDMFPFNKYLLAYNDMSVWAVFTKATLLAISG